MEEKRGRESWSEEGRRTSQVANSKGKGLPREFEGMNFEQQRGSYKNSDRGEGSKDSERQDGARERR